MKKPGHLVISLDFELMWGMFDKVTIDSYGKNLLGARTAIPEMLALFERYGIHATWGVVGMLAYENAAALAAALPADDQQPKYKNTTLSSYRHFVEQVKDKENIDQYYFAPELIEKIVNTPNQELASHTFSHYYCLEKQCGENGEAIFDADCAAVKAAFGRFDGGAPTSIIFPRNQTTAAALEVCQATSITAYRGTEDHFLYHARREEDQTNPFIRVLRLLDHYINLSSHHTYPLTSSINRTINITNLPASRFFRPYMPILRMLEPLRLRRIKNSMTHAAKRGEVFHLWWHPHNFGTNRKENFSNLITLLEHFKTLQTEFGMESKNMRELCQISKNENIT